MFCQYCGKQIDDNSKFCDFCGKPQEDLLKDDYVVAPNQDTPYTVAEETVNIDGTANMQPMNDVFDSSSLAQGMPYEDASSYSVDYGEPSKKKKGLSTNAIIGIIIAVSAVIAIVAVVLILVVLPSASGDSTDGDENANISQTESKTDGSSKKKSSENKSSSSSSTNSSSTSSNSNSSSSSSSSSSSNEVTLTVQAANGNTLTSKVRRDANDYVLADSSTREYSVSELHALNLTDAELCVAWNEPFARQGYHFKNPDLQAYFESCSWYVDRNNQSSLSGAAAINNGRLRQVAEENENSKRWESLATS